MSEFCATHRLPLAAVDPIDSEVRAWSLVSHAMHHPQRDEIIAVALDHDRRGGCITVVKGTSEPNAIYDVVEFVLSRHACHVDFGAVILASIRPGGGLDHGDIDRWLELTEYFDGYGIDLLEWFVVGRQVVCPRDLIGESPRWSR